MLLICVSSDSNIAKTALQLWCNLTAPSIPSCTLMPTKLGSVRLFCELIIMWLHPMWMGGKACKRLGGRMTYWSIINTAELTKRRINPIKTYCNPVFSFFHYTYWYIYSRFLWSLTYFTWFSVITLIPYLYSYLMITNIIMNHFFYNHTFCRLPVSIIYGFTSLYEIFITYLYVIHMYCHIQEDGGVWGYPTQDFKQNIPLRKYRMRFH